jgi:hypothetical protein
VTETGTLPKGLTFTGGTNGTATLTGAPAGIGIFIVTITAKNSAGSNAQTIIVLIL